MKSITRRFNNVSQKNSGLSTIVCFAMAITEQNFNRQTIARGFNKLVDKDDYDKKDKKQIIAFLERLTKRPEDNQKQIAKIVFRNDYSRVNSLVVKQIQSS